MAEERASASVAPPADSQDWQPRLIALDIDGTLLAWVEDEGQNYEQISPRVYDSIRRAYDAGAHIVLASGRSPHGMTPIADLLDLPADNRDRLWIVAANGAIVLRYPPTEIIHEELFDAGPAVREVLKHHPEAIVGVEHRGLGYRVSREFPVGELTGQQFVTDIDEMVAEPVSRVIVRDPSATAEDFVDLTKKLGLHGTDFIVGWTAWLDITPVGVSKASGLQYVADELGVKPEDCLAIGDGRNDLEMLAWAGRGVAMGQAIDEVKAAADVVTDSVHDDGTAIELERWFPA